MNCFPSCEILLPYIGKAHIRSKMDICKSPSVLTIAIGGNNEFKNSVTFFDEGPMLHYRRIGSEYWPLQLNVNFRNTGKDQYYADACIQTIKTGNTTCFMHGFIDSSVDNVCGKQHNNDGFPTIATIFLCVIFTLIISAAVIAMVYRFCASHKSKNKREPLYNNLKDAKEISPNKGNNEIIDFIDDEATNIGNDKTFLKAKIEKEKNDDH